MSLAERAPVAHSVQAALPQLQPGVSVPLLRRVWNATPLKRKHQRATLLDSIVTVKGAVAKPLRDLTLAEVEEAIGGIAPRFVVKFYTPGKLGLQFATFVERSDAETFAATKKLYTRAAEVRELTL